MNNAMGKWISTTCCACRASNAAFRSKGFISSPALLHDDFGRHLGMDRAEVRVRAGFREGVGEMIAGIEGLGFERGLVFTHHRMRHIVVVRPGDRGPGGNLQRHGAETKVIDFDFDLIGGIVPRPSRLASPCPRHQDEAHRRNCRHRENPYRFLSLHCSFSFDLLHIEIVYPLYFPSYASEESVIPRVCLPRTKFTSVIPSTSRSFAAGTVMGPGESAWPGAGCGNAVEHAVWKVMFPSTFCMVW